MEFTQVGYPYTRIPDTPGRTWLFEVLMNLKSVSWSIIPSKTGPKIDSPPVPFPPSISANTKHNYIQFKRLQFSVPHSFILWVPLSYGFPLELLRKSWRESAKEKWKRGECEGRRGFFSPPIPSSTLIFALVTTFSIKTRGNACHAG